MIVMPGRNIQARFPGQQETLEDDQRFRGRSGRADCLGEAE